jgi:hypothetical protein
MALDRGLPFSRRARDLGFEADFWPPYGVLEPGGQEQMMGWAEANGLRYSREKCIHWLMPRDTGDLARSYTKSGQESRDVHLDGRCSRIYYGFDHVTSWTRQGRPAVLVSQPYDIESTELLRIWELKRDGFSVLFHQQGWYGHGTFTTEVWAPGERPWIEVRSVDPESLPNFLG